MSQSIFSSSWYRVAALHPRLRGHAQIHRHIYRDTVWYVLQDHSTGRFHRFSAATNIIIGLMNGKRSLQEIWDIACDRLGDDVPTQDDVIGLVSSLHRGDVLQTEASPDMRELHERKNLQEKTKFLQYIQNPLSLRIPVWDPERTLDRLIPFSKILFGWFGLIAWILVVGLALVLAGSRWAELTKDVTDQVFATESMLLIAMVFPVSKLLHELGHALAIKAYGGEVHEMGVMFLVFMPIPYVDASSSIAFQDKWQRVVVGAAGMLVEVFFAALAMFVWMNAEPGVLRALSYDVMLVAGVSTLAFNINPLLRFDAYYMLMDLIEIPNLSQRSNYYLIYIIKRYILLLPGVIRPQASRADAVWFLVYAILSFVYRIIVSLTIALVVAAKYFGVGVLLAFWSLYLMVGRPLALSLAWFAKSTELHRVRFRVISIFILIFITLAGTVFYVPVPSWTLAEGIAWAPEDNLVRAGTDGLIERVLAAPEQVMRKGDPLIISRDPELEARVVVLTAQLAEQKARYTSAVHDRVLASLVLEEVRNITEQLEFSKKRLGELVIRSPADGVFVMADIQDAPGRYIRRGELLGYVLDFTRMTVKVVIPQSDIDLVRKTTHRVQLRQVERIENVISATIVRAIPAASDEIPGMALGVSGGGRISLDPGRGNEMPKAASTLFQFELNPDGFDGIRFLGSRIYARFEHDPEPLGMQWFRAVRRIFLKHFNV